MKNHQNNEPFKVIPLDRVKPTCRKQRSTWKFQELLKYTFFLHDLIEDGKNMVGSTLHKEDYKLMAKLITTRNANQCRMFHLKMTTIIGNTEEILTFFRSNIELYHEYHQKHQGLLQKQDNSTFTLPQTTHSEPLLSITYPTVQPSHLQVVSGEPSSASSLNLQGINLIDAYGWIDEVNAFIATFQHNWLQQDI